MPRRVGPLKRAKLISGRPAEFHQGRGHEAGQFRILERDVPERGPDVLGRRTRAVPPRLGHVQVLGPVPGDHLRQPGPPQEFDVLLPDPGAVPCGVGFPVDVRAAHVPAARMPLQHDRPAGQGAEQEVQRGRSRVGPLRVAVPGHLHQVALGPGEDLREDLGERRGFPGPRDTCRTRRDDRVAHRDPVLARPHRGRGRGGLVLDGRDAGRLAGALLLPEAEQSLLEPGADRRVIPRRFEQAPARRLGVLPLVIVEHDPRVVAELAVPLALRQQEPVERLAQAALQGLPEERLRVPHEADVRPASGRPAPRAGASGGRSRRGWRGRPGRRRRAGVRPAGARRAAPPAPRGSGRRNNRRAAGGRGRRCRDGSRPRRAGGARRSAPRPASPAARHSARTRRAARRRPRPRRRRIDRSPGRPGIRPGSSSDRDGRRASPTRGATPSVRAANS